MNKIIAVFDSLNYSESTSDHAVFISRKIHAHLVGIFLEDRTRHSYGITDLVGYEGAKLDQRLKELNNREQQVREEAIGQFEKSCRMAGLEFSIHRDRDIALQDVLHEAVYADLLVIDSTETLSRVERTLPTRFIKDLLSEVECPVLLVPPVFKEVEKIVLLYDGAPPSVHAIKMYSYLLKTLPGVEVEVLTVKKDGESLHLPDNKLLREFMKRHYSRVEYVVLKGFSEDRIVSHLKHQKKGTIAVLGSNRRSRLSMLIKESMADVLMKELDMALFIQT